MTSRALGPFDGAQRGLQLLAISRGPAKNTTQVEEHQKLLAGFCIRTEDGVQPVLCRIFRMRPGICHLVFQATLWARTIHGAVGALQELTATTIMMKQPQAEFSVAAVTIAQSTFPLCVTSPLRRCRCRIHCTFCFCNRQRQRSPGTWYT